MCILTFLKGINDIWGVLRYWQCLHCTQAMVSRLPCWSRIPEQTRSAVSRRDGRRPGQCRKVLTVFDVMRCNPEWGQGRLPMSSTPLSSYGTVHWGRNTVESKGGCLPQAEWGQPGQGMLPHGKVQEKWDFCPSVALRAHSPASTPSAPWNTAGRFQPEGFCWARVRLPLVSPWSFLFSLFF